MRKITLEYLTKHSWFSCFPLRNPHKNDSEEIRRVNTWGLSGWETCTIWNCTVGRCTDDWTGREGRHLSLKASRFDLRNLKQLRNQRPWARLKAGCGATLKLAEGACGLLRYLFCFVHQTTAASLGKRWRSSTCKLYTTEAVSLVSQSHS